MEEKNELEKQGEEINCDGIECNECDDYVECSLDCLRCETEEIKEMVGKSFLCKDLQILVLKLTLRALLLKFNSKPANEGMKSNIKEQIMTVVPNVLKDAESEVQKENMSEENFQNIKKEIIGLLNETLDEIFLPPEGIASNL